MTTPMPNLNLIREILSLIKTDPTHWDQSRWMISPEPKFSCGTAMCFAGHTVTLGGLEPIWTADFFKSGYYAAEKLTDGRLIHEAARELLGLTKEEASDLFESDNSFNDLKEIAKRIAARAGERLELNKYMEVKQRYNLVAARPATTLAEVSS